MLKRELAEMTAEKESLEQEYTGNRKKYQVQKGQIA